MQEGEKFYVDNFFYICKGETYNVYSWKKIT